MWQWGGKIFFSHGESNFRRVAILIAPDTVVKIHSISHGEYGRYLLLDCTFNEKNYVLLNVYAPTIDKVTEQVNFGHLLSNAMEKYFGHSVILGGNLNFNLENLKTFQKSQSHSYSRYLLHLIETHDLVDIWNLKYPGVYRFTRRENTRHGPVQSRIDYFLVTSHLEYVIETADIQPGLKSDHSLLKITILLENQPKHGSCLWKLNTSLLQDDNYIKLIKSTIQEGRLDTPNLNVKHLAWDYIKCRIRILFY